MNSAAQFTLRILGAVLVLFALAILLYPILKLTTPPIIEKSMDALIVAFVAMLARTGAETQQVQVTNSPANPVPTDPQENP